MFSPKVKLFKSPPVTPKKHLAVNFASDTIFRHSDFENSETRENRENMPNVENREVEILDTDEEGEMAQMDRAFHEKKFGPSPRAKHYPSQHRPVDTRDMGDGNLTPVRTSNPTDIDCELRARLQVFDAHPDYLNLYLFDYLFLVIFVYM
jgi:hypothetical protein